MRGRGKASGVDVETEFANLLHLRNHKVSRLCLYHDRERALADLGLAEQGDWRPSRALPEISEPGSCGTARRSSGRLPCTAS
jgi:hypothetical protein